VCAKAAEHIDANSEEFKRAVKREAERIYNSRFMTQFNKAKKEAWGDGLDKGLDYAYEQDFFHVPCSICGKPMDFWSGDDNWESQIKPTLYEAFKNWQHTSCAKNR